MSDAVILEEATRRQRMAADPSCSVWVGASAGTGKTRVLTERVLGLLLAGTSPGRVLCITFTKAAAAEMANRILKRLGDWAGMAQEALEADLAGMLGRVPRAGECARARRLFAEVLDAPGGLKIQTIHAFCQSLIGRFPIEAGVPPHAEVLDQTSARALLLDARDAVLRKVLAGDDEALVEAFTTLTEADGETTIGPLVDLLTTERARLSDLLEPGGLVRFRTALARALAVAPDASAEALIRDAARQTAALTGDLATLAEALERSSSDDQKKGRHIRKCLELIDADPAGAVAAYRCAFMKDDGEGPRYDKIATIPLQTRFPELIAIMEAEAARIEQLLEALKAVRTFERSLALATFARAVIERYEQAKRADAKLDYDDLVLKAGQLLRAEGGCSWVMYKLDERIDHILVDEAQDTNPEQWTVIDAITEEFFAGSGFDAGRPRTLFVVGDRKQSIYRFQRADPEAFIAMEARFRERVTNGRGEFRPVDLDVSFRSAPAILGAVDAVFALPAHAAGVAPGLIRHRAARAEAEGLVELWPLSIGAKAETEQPWTLPLVPESHEPPRSRLARMLAGRIRLWLDQNERLAARDRPLAPGDVMILLKKRGALQGELIRAFKQQGVEVAGVDRMTLSEQLAVQDLLAVARFALLPQDDLTLATVLRGPFVGLSEDELFLLAHNRPGHLWQALGAHAASSARLGAARDTLAAYLARADFLAPFEFFAKLLSEEGGRARLIERLGHQAGDPIDEFLAQCLAYERDNTPSLQGFLHWIERGDTEIKRDSAGRPRDEVRILTVHGAKGLEAPVVILADTIYPSKNRDPALFWHDGRLPVWSPRKAEDCRAAADLRAAREAAALQEYRRAFYVAMTRAEDRLYLTGWNKDAKPDARSWYVMAEAGLRPVAETVAFDFAEFGCPGWAGEGLRYLGPKAPVRAAELARAALAAAPVPPLPDWARRKAPSERVIERPLAPSRLGVDPPPRSPIGPDDGQRFARGRIIHRLMEILPDLPLERRAEAARAFLARPVHALTEAGQAEILGHCLRLLDDPRFGPVFAPGSRAEVPVVGRVGRHLVAGQIDRLAIADDALLIIDYKTNRPPPATVEDVTPAYLRQLAAYRALVAALHPARPVRAALLWTDTPSLMELPEDLLDRALADFDRASLT